MKVYSDMHPFTHPLIIHRISIPKKGCNHSPLPFLFIFLIVMTMEGKASSYTATMIYCYTTGPKAMS